MGLVDAAATTNAWIITTGTNAGVVQEVGEALNNYRYIGNKQGLDIPCIGIASWNYIADNSQLEITNPANSTRIQSYIVRKSPKGKCHLEPNHTHFLLFDDGKDNPSSVLGLRARIEMLSRDPSLAQRSHVHQVAYGFRTENGITSQDLITTQSTHMNTMQLPPIEPIWDTLIPIVMVLLEGGASSLNTVSKALKENTPIVVVKKEDLQRALVDALRRGHVDFVELLIELGASPAKLTVDDLERLYVSASIGSSLPCGKKKRRTIATRKDFYKAYLLEEPKGPIATFYNAHPLKRAREANCRKFIASPCVQRYLNNLW
ncbi:unnamed protein product [Rotaria sordida]|uniref:TRPM SLOG domain-containing protein n=1 Tax=Rotaria sordida TaxID=392033 RepID=A0A818UMF4_9BILA|nr:unnamed protein product [Rotaria sordida]